ncbi:hypothetical protein [Nocardioides flavescens]|uniref:Matrixin family metalloprotease n=1 Tax=Nocardioides flavescens TaxID=2691959 RepID=A0A6L7EY76_9ACTN|nr:hypothetical protein [Nocardioides flavescens]MXG89119.1 hypothetical protein [Nocardioides flavescens]
MAVVVIATSIGVSGFAAAAGNDEMVGACGVVSEGVIDVGDVPEGTDVVECDLTGRQLDLGEVVLAIPEPGNGLGVSGEYHDGDSMDAEVATAIDGTITYEASASEAIGSGGPSPSYSQNGCDTNYLGALKVWRLGGAFNFRIGDGGQPGGGTQAQTEAAVDRAGYVWKNETSPCFTNDGSSAPLMQAIGTTTYESDFTVVNGESTCGARDGVSTIDAGNLDGGYVAMNCTWYNSSNVVFESDIRFNTADDDFTYTPGSGCSTQYDVDSVMTHEMGHTLGMKDKTGAENSWQTMYGTSFPCKAFARNLGRSDVRHLRAAYPG